jgi:hypothetical protein
MTDPTNPKNAKTLEPHPASSHRSPTQIAKEEAGPGGGVPDGAEAAPKKAHSKEEEHVRAAVQRSAHRAGTADRRQQGNSGGSGKPDAPRRGR